MNRFLYYIIVVLILLVLFPMGTHAQDIDKLSENKVVTAVTALNSGDIDSAIRLLEASIEMSPENDAAYYYLSLCHASKKDMAKAETFMKKACELDPGNFWYRYRLASIYGVTSREELTTEIYEKLVEDFPRRSDLYFDMVELYSSQGEYDKALKTLDEVETVFGKTESTAVFRFNLLRQMDKNEEAFASLEEYNREYSSPYVLSTLADWQMSMYNDSTALAYYNEALLRIMLQLFSARRKPSG